MRRAERLFRLVNEMRTRNIVKAEELAAHFEVSIRTIYRDITHLQASGLPIVGEAGVGYLLRARFDLPNVTLTHDQMDVLAIGLAFVEGSVDPVLASAAREVRAKIQAGLPDPELRRLADAPYLSLQSTKDTPYMDALKEAIRRRKIVQMAYQNAAGQRSERLVRPLAIWNLTDGWMLTAWCELREEFRTFRLDRIAALSLTGATFLDEETKNLQAFLNSESCARY